MRSGAFLSSLVSCLFSSLMGLMFLGSFSCSVASAAEGTKDEMAAGKLFGEIQIATNRTEFGLTQTGGSPSIAAELGYRWPQFRLGIHGANVKFDSVEDSINLRLLAAYTFIFTSNANLSVQYNLNRYYKTGSRDGALVDVDLNLFTYHVLYDTVENFEATGNTLTRYGFGKEFGLPYSILLGTGVGYDMISDLNYANFFDVLLSLGYKLGELKSELIASYTSQADQFHGHGGGTVYLQFTGSF